MFHQKRFQGSMSGEKPTAHYSAEEQAKEERKQEKVQVEQKLDTLSAGLLNMLQAAQQQMDSKAVEAPVAGSPEAADSPAGDAPERRSGRADRRSPRHKAELSPKVKQFTPASAQKKSPK